MFQFDDDELNRPDEGSFATPPESGTNTPRRSNSEVFASIELEKEMQGDLKAINGAKLLISPSTDGFFKFQNKSESAKLPLYIRKRRKSTNNQIQHLNSAHRNKLDFTDVKSEKIVESTEETNEEKNEESSIMTGNNENTRAPLLPFRASAWKRAVKKAKEAPDPWKDFNHQSVEKCRRFRYHASTGAWTTDIILVQIESEPFNHGAMRQCHRLKRVRYVDERLFKLAQNYVAKQYMEEVSREIYEEDVKMQMDAKLYASLYNRRNPPKTVDVLQMCYIEFVDRPGKPLFHLEPFVTGHYIKYNSNSGFAGKTSAECRLTPNAFSHFTFEISGRRLVVCDIQGVGDLYTDPQIHTYDGESYGDGNLGTKGMALFFHSHICNSICKAMRLNEFDCSPNERDALHKISIGLPIKRPTMPRMNTIRSRNCLSESDNRPDFLPRSLAKRTLSGSSEDPHAGSFEEVSTSPPVNFMVGECEIRPDSTESIDRESECSGLTELAEVMLPEADSNRIMSQVHLDLAKYHALGRFLPPNVSEKQYDKDSALYHLKRAAELGSTEAIVNLSKIYLNMPHDILSDLELDESDENSSRGWDLILMGAEQGDRDCMVKVAKAYETGVEGIAGWSQPKWDRAVEWFIRASNWKENDVEGEFDGTMYDPNYTLMASAAAMYKTGGYGLISDAQKAGDLLSEAAEMAMEAMKGKLSSKFYMQAEECYALASENDANTTLVE